LPWKRIIEGPRSEAVWPQGIQPLSRTSPFGKGKAFESLRVRLAPSTNHNIAHSLTNLPFSESICRLDQPPIREFSDPPIPDLSHIIDSVLHSRFARPYSIVADSSIGAHRVHLNVIRPMVFDLPDRVQFIAPPSVPLPLTDPPSRDPSGISQSPLRRQSISLQSFGPTCVRIKSSIRRKIKYDIYCHFEFTDLLNVPDSFFLRHCGRFSGHLSHRRFRQTVVV
jgi:hypothetical protein